MEKLYKIMGDLSEIAFNMESLSCILESLEEHYQYKQEYETYKNIVIFKIVIDFIFRKTNDTIEEMDRFILNSR